ncbi:c-type cytochrome [Oceaniglobus indicus]|uniref:c-type cytochrome n=1 Tax=Oceaniglobus indicus TaxID=2047749 RepID=UPI000C183918|nr:cytochrome c [Oceaniglobus indicus]
MRRYALLLPFVAAAVVAACTPPPVEVGRGLYNDVCAACHGATGKGDGRLAGDLGQRPPDLTMLTARNGGVFPQAAVMGVIDGYHRRDDPHGEMPVFGDLLAEGNLVGVDTGDGRLTPTPERLVALAAYVERLQK